MDQLPKVTAGKPETYIGYKEAHNRLGLIQRGSTFGESLQHQGLNNLAEWTEREGHPAITGLIIDTGKYLPGPGYFKLFGRVHEDYSWWQSEVEKSQSYDWNPYLELIVAPATSRASDDWSDEELRSAVSAYLRMVHLNRHGEKFSKKAIYEELAHKFARTAKAFEYRMQNISYVLTLMGRDWLVGLRPAKNVGAKNAARIEAIIMELEQRPLPPIVEFEVTARNSLNQNQNSPPKGNSAPQTQMSATTQFKRDPAVKAWILMQANGVCECCDEPAPFNGSDGQPFLEVHHVRTLADKGSDTIYNAIAACPNCHRALHYSLEAKQMIKSLLAKNTRLKPE